MEKAFKNIRIQNFKSIKDIQLRCSRINLFIGKPNVGKSNILEALSLFAAPYSQNEEKYLSEFMRYRNFSNLFYDDNIREPILITSNLGNGHLFYDEKERAFLLAVLGGSIESTDYDTLKRDLAKKIDRVPGLHTNSFPISVRANTELDISFLKSINSIGNIKQLGVYIENFEVSAIDLYTAEAIGMDTPTQIEINVDLDSIKYTSSLKKYTFKEGVNIGSQGDYSLQPPFGDNLFLVMQTNPELRKEIVSFFEEYDMDFVLDMQNNEFEVQKKVDGIVYKRPYQLIADTLQRIIFHYAAIYSNKDSILLFEEPENHSFPPYVRELAYKIVDDESNQFFITTHSPYLFSTIIDNTQIGEVSVFITNFDQHQTKVKQLTEDEIVELTEHGLDIFFNLKWFENE